MAKLKQPRNEVPEVDRDSHEDLAPSVAGVIVDSISGMRAAKQQEGITHPPTMRPNGKRRRVGPPRQGKMIGGANGIHGWMPGVSGNPAGRPKGRTLFSVISKILRTPRDGDKDEMYYAARAYVKMMQRGSFPHMKEIIDREEGRLPLPVTGQIQAAIIVKEIKDVSMDDL